MLMLQMVFLDFFEALLGCAEVYVVEASEQRDVTGKATSDEQHPDITAVDTTDQITTSSMSHSLSVIEQVLLTIVDI